MIDDHVLELLDLAGFDDVAEEVKRLRAELEDLKARIGDLQASEWQIGYEHGVREALTAIRCEPCSNSSCSEPPSPTLRTGADEPSGSAEVLPGSTGLPDSLTRFVDPHVPGHVQWELARQLTEHAAADRQRLAGSGEQPGHVDPGDPGPTELAPEH